MDYSLVGILKALGAIGLGVALSLLLFAPIIEVTDPNEYSTTIVDPASGLSIYKPNTSFTALSGCFENTAVINNMGFHGTTIAPKKDKDVFRIVVVGSSLVEARQVGVDQLFTTLLQQKLNADPNRRYTYEVVNLGVNGNTTFLNTLYYKYYGSPLQPDLVIDLESAFETYHKLDSPPFDDKGNILLEPPKIVESKIASIVHSVSRHSKLVVNLYNRLLVLKDGVHTFLSAPLFFMQSAPQVASSDTQEAAAARWALREKLVTTLAHQVSADNAKFLFATWVGPEEATSTRAEIPTRMTSMAARSGFQYTNLVPVVEAEQAVTGKSATFLPCDGHFSPEGHVYIANALYAYITAHPDLLRHKL